jgi:H+/Cl- antiporter ClcA
VGGLPGIAGKFQRGRPVLFAGICGVMVAAIGVASGGLTYGSGYLQAKSILEDGVHPTWAYSAWRALATLVTYVSGIPAGLLAPSLSVGTGIGQLVADATGGEGLHAVPTVSVRVRVR